MERGDLTGAILDGRYRVIEPVGQGAMGTVYRAERVKLGRMVAIKVLHEVLPNELSGRKRFEIEAMAMAKLEHPHCASVLDVGVHKDRPYVVMDFVRGQNLKELIATGAQPIPRAVEIVRQVLSGLAHAHELGIIHRDIKPANLVLSQKAGLGDHVKILDFGLARLHDTGQNLTTGIVVGTPAYMAPEQIRGHKLDGRADLYACGVLLFELLTAEKPFESEKDDPIEICRLHLTAPVPRLDDKRPGIDFGELEPVAARALAKDREDRYASAEAFAAALDAAVVRRPSRLAIPPVAPPGAPGGSMELGSRDLLAADDSSSRPATEVGSGDVFAADERSSDAPAPGSRAQVQTPPAGTPAAMPADDDPDPPSQPGTFLGLPVRPPTVAQADEDSSMADRPPRTPGRWRVLAAIAAVAVVGAIGIAAAIVRHGRPDEAAAPGAASGSALAPDPTRELADQASEIAAQGDRDAALELLHRARRQYPDSALLAYTAGRICFSKFYWTEGLRSFREAIRSDPSYRADPELIKIVLRGFITTPGYNDDLASFLREDIGGPAEPFLEETARDHPNPAIRSRAANELRRYH